ncbi:MAG: adenylate/guanylate cyclase domain-containing protein [Planctomycetaceae bacterium]|nr:adenylate/guanylate cyclase domain-containing protein [Planctomycetaceae bacterium]
MNRLNARQLWSSTWARGVRIGLIAALLSWVISLHPLLASLEIWAYDTCFIVREKRDSSCPVTLIALDDASLSEIEKPINFLSPELKEIVEYLTAQGVAAIGLDLMIPEELEDHEYLKNTDKEGNAEGLGAAVLLSGKVVLPVLGQSQGQRLLPVAQWRVKRLFDPQLTDYGFVNLTPDPDRFIRKQLLLARLPSDSEEDIEEQTDFAHFAHSLVKVARGATDIETDDLPLHNGELIINFVGPPGSVDRVSFADAWAASKNPDLDSKDWSGRIVIFGGTAEYLGDRHPTPFANASVISEVTTLFGRPSAQEMPGPEIHANIVATLYDRAFLTYPSRWVTLLVVCLTGAMLGPLMVRASLEGAFGLLFTHHVLWRLATYWLFYLGSQFAPIIPVLMTGFLTYAITFGRRWKLMRRTVGMFKSEAVAKVVEADPSRMALRGETREVTVLFSDVRNFTTFSEEHEAQEVVALLNHYFGKVVPAVEEGGGIVNQYIGDGLMVLFGAPIPRNDHPFRAVQVAIRMIQLVHENKAEFARLGAEDFRIGIGIYTGTAVLGTIGSPKRLDYTAIGDTVNTAARIESATKTEGVEILVGQTTYDQLSESDRKSLGVIWEDPRRISVKGKHREILVHPVLVDVDGHSSSYNQI